MPGNEKYTFEKATLNLFPKRILLKRFGGEFEIVEEIDETRVRVKCLFPEKKLKDKTMTISKKMLKRAD